MKINRAFVSFNHLASSFLKNLFGLKKKVDEPPAGYTADGVHYHDGAENDAVILLRKGPIPLWKIYPKHQLLGAFYPFIKLKKDFTDILNPYYSSGKIERDGFQILRGVNNALAGAVGVLGGVLALSVWGLSLLFILIAPVPVLTHIVYPISWITEGLGNIIRGAAQIGSYPLTIIIKIPLRVCLTFFSKRKLAEDKPEIQRFAEEGMIELDQINKFQPLPPRPTTTAELNNYLHSKQYQEARAANKTCHYSRQKVAATLFEVQRKYTRSINDGWQTECAAKTALINFKYKSMFSTFKAAADITYSELYEESKPIPQRDLDTACSYLNEFLHKK